MGRHHQQFLISTLIWGEGGQVKNTKEMAHLARVNQNIFLIKNLLISILSFLENEANFIQIEVNNHSSKQPSLIFKKGKKTDQKQSDAKFQKYWKSI